MVSTWGGEHRVAHAHAEFGQEFAREFGPRTMISFTTDPEKAKELAKGGPIYRAMIDPCEANWGEHRRRGEGSLGPAHGEGRIVEGLTLRLGRREVVYYPAGVLVNSDEGVADFDELEDRLLAEHPRMRRLVVRFRPMSPLRVYYLHWSNGTDLAELDARLSRGAGWGEDLGGAVVGEAVDIQCRNCGASHRIVMLEATDALFDDALARTRAHAYHEHCAVCGVRWTASVLEFIPPHL
ncbi:hypothetical protein R8Z50_18230 [Longispora sp. K20-0274]|uniref:hypothetical protein n=1 Tax=Longispora sp. K20-0274 TaxID=3088255 RepID=UPI00399A323A